jgi:plasmid maintenance system antidote protein VapI
MAEDKGRKLDVVNTGETFEAALRRYLTEGGYSIKKVRDLVLIAAGLGISVPALEEMINGKTAMTPALADKLAAFFKTNASYWVELQQERDRQDSPKVGRNVCRYCGKEIDNPNFCNTSHAAKYNNRAYPKRKPEGECQRCHKAIRTVEVFCDDCQPIVTAENEAARVRKENNIRSWQSISGECRENQIVSVESNRKVIFDYGDGFKPFTYKSKIGDVIDFLLGLCFAKPDYIREDQLPRYIALLNDLKAFKFLDWNEEVVRKAVLKAPLNRIGHILSEWVHAFLDAIEVLRSQITDDQGTEILANAVEVVLSAPGKEDFAYASKNTGERIPPVWNNDQRDVFVFWRVKTTLIS